MSLDVKSGKKIAYQICLLKIKKVDHKKDPDPDSDPEKMEPDPPHCTGVNYFIWIMIFTYCAQYTCNILSQWFVFIQMASSAVFDDFLCQGSELDIDRTFYENNDKKLTFYS